MAAETEIKLRIEDPKALQRKLKKLGAKLVYAGTGRVHELNVLFDTPEGKLGKSGQLLRIRTETHEPGKKSRPGKLTQRTVLTFKRPPEESPATIGETPSTILPAQGRYKVREEIELEVQDAGTMGKVFAGLGMRGWFRYEKYRTTYQLGARHKWAKALLIELDEVPIGTFVELEGPAEAIDRVAKELGFARKDYLTTNYLVLYLDSCRKRGVPPGDMMFEERKKERKKR
jgi:adenylate cyclase class IV